MKFRKLLTIGLTVSMLASGTTVYAEKEYDREVKSKVGITLDVGDIQQISGDDGSIVKVEDGKLYLDKVGSCYVTLSDGTVLYLTVLDKSSNEEMVLGDGIIAEIPEDYYDEGVSEEDTPIDGFTDLNQEGTDLEIGNDSNVSEGEIQSQEGYESETGKKDTESGNNNIDQGDDGFTSAKGTDQKSENSKIVDVTATPNPSERVEPSPMPTVEATLTPTPTEKVEEVTSTPTTVEVTVTPTPKEGKVEVIPTEVPKKEEEITPTPTEKVEEITPTPTVEVTPIPTEKVEPTPTVEVTPTPTVEVTPSPIMTVTPTSEVSTTPEPIETPVPTPTEILKKDEEEKDTGKISVDDILKGKDVDTGITPEDTTEVSLNSKKLEKSGVAKVKSSSKIRESTHTGNVGTHFVLPILEGNAKEYLSTDESVAKVSANGTVLLVGEGRAKVFVTTDDKVYACNVISLNTDFDNSDVLLDWGTSSYQLEVGGTFLGEKPTYSLFKDSDIASIDENGLLTFNGSGDVIVQTDVAGLKLNKKIIRNSRRKYLWDGMQPAIEQCLGTPYVFGGETPGVGLDCSAYVSYVLRSVGLMSGRESAQGLYNMFGVTSNPQPGDIVYFAGTYDADGDYITHVGIYAGDGMMYHSGKPNQKQAIVGYYAEHLVGYGSITGE